MSGIVRLFVGNTPHSAQKEDIHTLVSKICPVHDVYIPPRTITGLPRSFAIVEIKSDMKDLRKCLQLLNNTNWKGSRLRIEVARPFYVDRLQSERRLELEPAICTEDSPPYLDHEGTPDAATVEVPLVLKIKKSMAQTITVHTVPLDTKEPEEPPDPNRNSSFNKKIKYKPRKLGRALRFYFDDDGSRRVAPIALDVSGPPLEPSSAAKPVVAAAPIITKPLGGGAKQRMGFGFAAKDSLRADADEDTMACVQDPVAQKWHSKTVGGLSLNDGRFQDRFKGGEHAALDDYYEFAEHWEAPPERVEEEEEEAVMGPVVPSVAAEEVTEAFLAEERSRLLATLQRLSKRNPESSAVGADIDNPRPRVAQVATKSWGSAIVARYDPSAASAEVFLTKEKRAAAAESFDLNFEDSRPAETFANLAVLKDIFHPEESTTGHTNKSEDALFLETEKLALNTAMGDAGGMSFNFFGPSEEVPSRGSATAAGETSWEAGASMEQSVAHEYFGEITSSNIPPLEDISFVKIVQAAVQFRREKTEEVIHARWLETRDKLGLAYKKKRREARKKRANVSIAVRQATDSVVQKRKIDFNTRRKKSAKRHKKA